MLRTTLNQLDNPFDKYIQKCKNCFSISLVLTDLQADDSAVREAVVHSAFLAKTQWAKPADVMATVCCGCARTNQPSSQRRGSAGTGFTTSQHRRGVCVCDDEQMIKYVCMFELWVYCCSFKVYFRWLHCIIN